MSYDLSGMNPKSKPGEHFRNNFWWWVRLSKFVLEHVDIPASQRRNWDSNDGQEVSGKTALRIAAFLRYALQHTEEFESWTRESEDGLRFSWENVARFAEFCEQSGGFVIF